MKKPNEKANPFLHLTPAEEKAILRNFERFVANFQPPEPINNTPMKGGLFPTLFNKQNTTLRWVG